MAPWTFSRTGVDKLVGKLGLPEEIDSLATCQIYFFFTSHFEVCKDMFGERPGSEEGQSLV